MFENNRVNLLIFFLFYFMSKGIIYMELNFVNVIRIINKKIKFCNKRNIFIVIFVFVFIIFWVIGFNIFFGLWVIVMIFFWIWFVIILFFEVKFWIFLLKLRIYFYIYY